MGRSKDIATSAKGDADYVNVSGDTMTGNLLLGSNKIGIGTSSPAKPLSVVKANGGDFIAEFQNTTSGTPYGVHVKDASSGSNGYPLLQVTNSAGNSTHFRVDSGTGIVLKPNQPAFRAYPSSTQANVTGASQLHSNGYVWTSLFNIGNHFNNSGTFTAPVAGRYVFIGHWTVYGADSNFGDAAYHMFIKNNNTGGNNGSYATSGMSMWDARGSTWDQLYTGFGGSAIMNLAANDAVTMYGGVLDGGGNNLDLVGSNVWYTTIMSGYLIG